VLDEPAAMLDPVSRRELLQHLKILNRREGMTIVLCSNEAEDFMDADRLLVIDRGTLCLQGTPPEVLSQGAQLASIGLAQPDFYRLRQQLADAGCPVTAIYNLTGFGGLSMSAIIEVKQLHYIPICLVHLTNARPLKTFPSRLKRVIL
jgi:ABC-type multidrug transport system ATPase subunit